MWASLGISDITVRVVSRQRTLGATHPPGNSDIRHFCQPSAAKICQLSVGRRSDFRLNTRHLQAPGISCEELPVWRRSGSLQILKIRIERRDVGPESSIHPISAHTQLIRPNGLWRKRLQCSGARPRAFQPPDLKPLVADAYIIMLSVNLCA